MRSRARAKLRGDEASRSPRERGESRGVVRTPARHAELGRRTRRRPRRRRPPASGTSPRAKASFSGSRFSARRRSLRRRLATSRTTLRDPDTIRMPSRNPPSRRATLTCGATRASIHRSDPSVSWTLTGDEGGRPRFRFRRRRERRELGSFPHDVPRLRREPRDERVALLRGDPRELREVRPRRLGGDVVGSDPGGDPAPIADAAAEQRAPTLAVADGAAAASCVVGLRREIRGDLDLRDGSEDQARARGGPRQLVERRLRPIAHAGILLGAKVLDDDLLHVPAPLPIALPDGEERVHALLPRLAYPHQYPGREGHVQLAREVEGSNPSRGPLRLAIKMRRARLVHQPIGRRLEHQPLRDAHLPQLCQLRPRQHPRVAVR